LSPTKKELLSASIENGEKRMKINLKCTATDPLRMRKSMIMELATPAIRLDKATIPVAEILHISHVTSIHLIDHLCDGTEFDVFESSNEMKITTRTIGAVESTKRHI
jgi:hypothetical protein